MRLRRATRAIVALGMAAILGGGSSMFAQSHAEIRPADDEARLELAKAEWRAGRLQQARKNLQLLLKRRPNEPRAIMLMGLVEEKSGDFPEAARLLTSIPLAIRTEPAAAAALARSCYHIGTVEQARLCLEPAQGASPQGIFMAAIAAADAEDFEMAEAMFVSIRPSYPDQAAIAYQLALVQYHEGHIADSRATLLDMIARGEGNANVHNLLGWCWFKSDYVHQAEQELNEAIRLDPSAVTNYLDLTRIGLAGRQLDAALDNSRRTVKLFPASPEAWLLKGSTETASQRMVDAVASYATAVHLSRNDAEAELALANAQSLAGMTTQSRASFQRLLQRYPRNPAVYITYAEFLSSTEPADTARVAGLMKTALSLDPSQAAPHYYLGNLALTGGKLDEAVQQLEAATRLEPDDSKAHFALSRALRQQGKEEESARELDIYKQLKMAENGTGGPVQ